jgi:hypothetical protein
VHQVGFSFIHGGEEQETGMSGGML